MRHRKPLKDKLVLRKRRPCLTQSYKFKIKSNGEYEQAIAIRRPCQTDVEMPLQEAFRASEECGGVSSALSS